MWGTLPTGIPIIRIITAMGITLTATFRSIMILTTSIMEATLTITLVTILVAVTTGEVVLDRQAQGRAFLALPWWAIPERASGPLVR